MGQQFEQVHQVGMRHVRQGPELLLEHVDRLGLGSVGDLQGDLVLPFVVKGLEHFPEAPGTQAPQNRESFRSLEIGHLGAPAWTRLSNTYSAGVDFPPLPKKWAH
jgi:hypothetical protein